MPCTCSPRVSQILSSRPVCTRLKNISRLRFVVASRFCITGLALKVRCGVFDFLSLGEPMLKSNTGGAIFADRSDSGEDRDGVYAE